MTQKCNISDSAQHYIHNALQGSLLSSSFRIDLEYLALKLTLYFILCAVFLPTSLCFCYVFFVSYVNCC